MKVTTNVEKTPKLTFGQVENGDVFTYGQGAYHFVKCGNNMAIRLGELHPGQDRALYPEKSLEVKIAKEINITY